MAIMKTDCYCALKETTVTAMIQAHRTGKGKNTSEQLTVIMCDGATQCNKSDYCKFVNPLSNRNPLEMIQTTEPTNEGIAIR